MICLTDISFIYEQCDLHNTDLRIWNRVYKRKTCQGSCDRDRIRTCDRSDWKSECSIPQLIFQYKFLIFSL